VAAFTFVCNPLQILDGAVCYRGSSGELAKRVRSDRAELRTPRDHVASRLVGFRRQRTAVYRVRFWYPLGTASATQDESAHLLRGTGTRLPLAIFQGRTPSAMML